MKALIHFVILSIVVLYSVSNAKKLCGFVCNDWDYGCETDKIGELLNKNLKKDGPADGICLKKDKYILNGTTFGLPTKCFCVDTPSYTKIPRGIGPRCVDPFIASPQETMLEFKRRNHDAFQSFAPSNGWCPKDKIKWVIRGKLIGRPKDICYCVTKYVFASPKVQCVDVSSSSSSEEKPRPHTDHH